jgi:hypothetical protein
MQMVSPRPAPIDAVQVQSIPSAVVSTAASKQAIASSDLDPKHDLVQCLVSLRFSETATFVVMTASFHPKVLTFFADHWNQHRCSHRKPRLSLAHFEGIACEFLSSSLLQKVPISFSRQLFWHFVSGAFLFWSHVL